MCWLGWNKAVHFIQLNTETHREGTVAMPIHVVYELLQASSTHVLYRVPTREQETFQRRNHWTQKFRVKKLLATALKPRMEFARHMVPLVSPCVQD